MARICHTHMIKKRNFWENVWTFFFWVRGTLLCSIGLSRMTSLALYPVIGWRSSGSYGSQYARFILPSVAAVRSLSEGKCCSLGSAEWLVAVHNMWIFRSALIVVLAAVVLVNCYPREYNAVSVHFLKIVQK